MKLFLFSFSLIFALGGCKSNNRTVSKIEAKSTPGEALVISEINANCNPKGLYEFNNYKLVDAKNIQITNHSLEDGYLIKFTIDKCAAKPIYSAYGGGPLFYIEQSKFDSKYSHKDKEYTTGSLIKTISYPMMFIKTDTGWIVRHDGRRDGDLYERNTMGL